jgi:low temperature requirement protein LtrA
MAGVSPIATFGESLSERVRDIFDEITAWAERLGAIDFLLIAVVVWAIYWTISTLRGMTRPRPLLPCTPSPR